MKKIILTYGLIAGTIVAILMLITMPMLHNEIIAPDSGELVGYTTMVIALSMIFFGIKSFRDNYANGVVTFWRGCQIGLLITLIAAVMYGLAWEVTYSRIGESFMAKMTNDHIEGLRESGASEAEVEKARVEWESFIEMYKNPFIRFSVTLTEILPVGIILTLLSAGLLRKKEFLPDEISNQSTS